MCLLHIARHRKDDFLFGVQHHIQDEGQPGAACGPHHILVNGIAFQNAGPGLLMRDMARAVVLQHGGTAGNTRQNSLSATGKARKKVRFNKPLRHQQIRLHRQAVHDAAAPGGKLPNIRQVFGVVAVMNNDLLPPAHFLTELVQLLRLCHAAVAARRHQNGDVRLRGAPADFFKQQRKGDLAGHGTGMVAGNNDNVFLSLGQLAQPWLSNGVFQCQPHKLLLVVLGHIALHAGKQHIVEPLLLQCAGQMAPAVRKLNFSHKLLLSAL